MPHIAIEERSELNERTDEYVVTLNEHLMAPFVSNLSDLPPSEIKYYLALLLACIENEPNPEEHILLLGQVDALIRTVKNLNNEPHNAEENLARIIDALHDLIYVSKMKTPSHSMKKAIIGCVSSILSFIIGVIAGAAGFFIGLFGAPKYVENYQFTNSLNGAGLGIVTGWALGAFAGTRLVSVAAQSPFERKLEFCINSLEKVTKELPTKQPWNHYYEETKQYLLDTFFKDTPADEQQEVFEAFLASEQSFQVCTTSAKFIDKQLKGNLGHHFLIRYTINGVTDIPIAFDGREGLRTPNFVDQSETPRTVSGAKLFEMMVLDRELQVTNPWNLNFISKHYDIGSNDCRTFVDKILIGTNQAPTQISRFNSSIDKPLANHLVGPAMKFFSKTKETELHPFIKHFDDGRNHPEVRANRWEGKSKKKEPAVIAESLETVQPGL